MPRQLVCVIQVLASLANRPAYSCKLADWMHSKRTQLTRLGHIFRIFLYCTSHIKPFLGLLAGLPFVLLPFAPFFFLHRHIHTSQSIKLCSRWGALVTCVCLTQRWNKATYDSLHDSHQSSQSNTAQITSCNAMVACVNAAQITLKSHLVIKILASKSSSVVSAAAAAAGEEEEEEGDVVNGLGVAEDREAPNLPRVS